MRKRLENLPPLVQVEVCWPRRRVPSIIKAKQHITRSRPSCKKKVSQIHILWSCLPMIPSSSAAQRRGTSGRSARGLWPALLFRSLHRPNGGHKRFQAYMLMRPGCMCNRDLLISSIFLARAYALKIDRGASKNVPGIDASHAPACCYNHLWSANPVDG